MNAIIYGPHITPGELALSILMAEGDVREIPPGSNRGPRVDVYLRACGLDPARGRYPWCAAAVTWAIREAGLRLSMLKFRGSASVSNVLARNKALEILVADVRPGDVLIHVGPKGNHCGLFVNWGTSVVGVSEKNTHIRSHEGNTDEAGGRTGGRLMTKLRPRAYWTHALRVA